MPQPFALGHYERYFQSIQTVASIYSLLVIIHVNAVLLVITSKENLHRKSHHLHGAVGIYIVRAQNKGVGGSYYVKKWR
ncbi:transmembrane protein, putative [Medicago truncatula]|uniref:Transmembrane protein, putative n=1 Tax=Medicago truncatula TaxID=3880 RepID=G7J7U5_MEDTR|nr:transmembrane protein, putative [Medicago truncatula]